MDWSLEFGVVGATTNIRFTVLCFTSAVGEPVLCSVILKSDRQPHEIPISWRLGIDITKDFNRGETRAEVFEINTGNNKPMAGGPTCTFNGKCKSERIDYF
jgi:hypothetical protein